MKAIKTLALLFIAAIFTLSVSAQTAGTNSTSKSTTTSTTAKTATPAAKPTATKDPVDPKLKGPKGEVVYTGTKGGKYYFTAGGTKTYLKKK